MHIGIIIQARMGSTRLPGKVLKKIGDKLLLEHIIHRLQYLKHKVTIVVATSNEKKDDLIEKFCIKNNIRIFRGSEENVLERYYKCSIKYKFDNIARLTADNPFVDIGMLNKLIDLHINNDSDYSKSIDILPVGVGAEIFKFKALEKSYFNGKLPHHIEHVNEYILENKDQFKVLTLNDEEFKTHKNMRLTVDTLDDYKKACYIVKSNNFEYVDTKRAIELCLEYA